MLRLAKSSEISTESDVLLILATSLYERCETQYSSHSTRTRMNLFRSEFPLLNFILSFLKKKNRESLVI